MIPQKTVLILGAGASSPYGFPTGRQMIIEIAQQIEYNKMLPKVNNCGFSNERILKQFGIELLKSNQPSIDTFLENRPHYLELGKAVIAAYLIPFEDPNKIKRTLSKLKWYEYIFNNIGTSLKDFFTENLKIVTFNYDRSFEYALRGTLINAFNSKDDVINEVFDKIKIVHIYGQLAKPHFLYRNGRDFETDLHYKKIIKAQDNIKIMSDDDDVSIEIGQAQEFISEADRICFLGFGYHEINLDRLFDGVDIRYKDMYCSVYNIKEGKIQNIRSYLEAKLDKSIYLGEETEGCLEFLQSINLFSL